MTPREQVLARRAAVIRRRVKAGRVPPQAQPDGVRRAYFQELRAIMRRARELVAERLMPLLPELLAAAQEARGDSARMDAPLPPGERVNHLMDAVSAQFYKEMGHEKLARLARKYAGSTKEQAKAQLAKQIRAIAGIDPPLTDANLGPLIELFTAENVGLIKSIPNQYFDEIEKRTLRAVADGERAEDLVPELMERYNVSESRAQLIANDQIGKFYGEIQRVKQTELGVEAYRWRTSRDNRVRDEHAQREGTLYRWDDPPEDGHPGHAINCRCYAEPDFTAILESL